ncbi:c-type cytochrome [Sphingobacterium psychroaquaticum]|uniref:Cytochrome C oxidase, cbb3-type, subunit III n=1 Tax=Sphingobacterium psychroaquaticum TaxID=561061 RepID=A0A1X7K0J6_9SPHI|nr:cytochrome c [Sphingobacterium psychroaquaticum]QBQ42455.1 cytochrome c [Sphingobacterium psychroaquaticum]SMG34340.1 Cytochrome C oxidase, cbb3-type, subunit III [Sphingobacterium psychroaquaticum]
MKENMLAMNKKNFLGSVCAAFALAAVVSSCGDGTKRSTGWEFSRNMYDPIAYNPDQPNNNFKNNITAQLPPSGTTPIGFERFEFANSLEEYERAGRELTSPLAVTKENLAKGDALFHTYCAVCHGKDGKGDGPLTKDRSVEDSRGKRQLENFPPPPSYAKSDAANSSRGGLMSDLTDGKIYHTIYYGHNTMGSHASQLSPEERWQVVMYVHELQKK